MSSYQRISIEEMNEFMEARSFKQIVVPGTHELVFVKAVTDKADLEIRNVFLCNLGRNVKRCRQRCKGVSSAGMA